MQSVSQGFLNALQGSFTPIVRVDAWYGGALVMENVPILSGSVTVDSSRLIAASATVTAASPDDTLVPSGWDAPLAPYGSELQIRCGLQTGAGTTEFVSLGWFRIDRAKPSEWWAPYYDQAHSTRDPQWVCRGVKVDVEASDRMAKIEDDRFLAPEAPASLASVITEIKRLARDYVPIADLSGVTDAVIPASVAYQESRAQALQDLATVLNRVPRINPNGALTLHPSAPTGNPVWTISVGRGDGEIVDWGRELSRQGLYNAVVATGTAPDGTALLGVAVENSGPLRSSGPFGRVPFGHFSPLLTSADSAAADASTRLNTLIRQRVVPVTVACTANYALEVDDVIQVDLPDTSLVGPITSIEWPLPSATMRLVMSVPRSQLWS